MTTSQSENAAMALPQSSVEALAYKAPFLIEKLLKDRIVDTADEAETLFTEVKRFLVLVQADRSKIWDMYSLRVDGVWHQFILFTRQYMEFCQRFFGGYMPHVPSNAPEVGPRDPAKTASFADFEQRYRELFGAPVSDAWFDAKSVTPWRRILNDRVGTLQLHQEGDMITLSSGSGEMLLCVNDVAQPALAFIAQTGGFYVRELPGLDDEEKVAVVAALVEYGVLRVAA